MKTNTCVEVIGSVANKGRFNYASMEDERNTQMREEQTGHINTTRFYFTKEISRPQKYYRTTKSKENITDGYWFECNERKR